MDNYVFANLIKTLQSKKDMALFMAPDMLFISASQVVHTFLVSYLYSIQTRKADPFKSGMPFKQYYQ